MRFTRAGLKGCAGRLALVGVVVAATMAGVSAAGQRAPATDRALLEHLAGRWVLRGTIDGKLTTHDVDAALVLNRGYVQLHEISREKDARGAPAYEAFVTIGVDPQSGEYTCMWLDNTSSAGLIPAGIARARPTATSIPFLFRVGRTVFHTTFVYAPSADTWQWAMDDESPGALVPFARVTLTRR